MPGRHVLPRPLSLTKELYVFGRLTASLCVDWIMDDGNDDDEGGEDKKSKKKRRDRRTDIGFDRTLKSGAVVHYVTGDGLTIVSIEGPAATVVMDGVDIEYCGGDIYDQKCWYGCSHEEPPGGPGPAVGNDYGLKVAVGGHARLQRCSITSSNDAGIFVGGRGTSATICDSRWDPPVPSS